MTKSTRGVTTAPSGSRTRGKYTFVISDLFPAMLAARAVERRLEVRRPHDHAGEDEDRVRQTSSDGKSAKRPKMSVKMPVASSGWSTTQRIPMNVCL